jgi:hypothetical protein
VIAFTGSVAAGREVARLATPAHAALRATTIARRLSARNAGPTMAPRSVEADVSNRGVERSRSVGQFTERLRPATTGEADRKSSSP